MPRCFLAAKLKYPYVQWKEEQGADRREDDISVDEDEEIDVENDDDDTPALKYLQDLRRQAEHRVNLHFYPQDENMNITNPVVKKEISQNVSRITEHQPSVADEESSLQERLSFQLKYETHARNVQSDDYHHRLSPHQSTPEQSLPEESSKEGDTADVRGAGTDYDHLPARAYPCSFREKGALQHVS